MAIFWVSRTPQFEYIKMSEILCRLQKCSCSICPPAQSICMASGVRQGSLVLAFLWQYKLYCLWIEIWIFLCDSRPLSMKVSTHYVILWFYYILLLFESIFTGEFSPVCWSSPFVCLSVYLRTSLRRSRIVSSQYINIISLW